jgi:hypothetical protein
VDTCRSASPPRVYSLMKLAAGMAPNGADGVGGVDGDTWIRTSVDVLAVRRQSKNGTPKKPVS